MLSFLTNLLLDGVEREEVRMLLLKAKLINKQVKCLKMAFIEFNILIIY